jgi:thymidylate synthase ThyX
MSIEAKIIKDSISANTGIRLTTMQLRYPRFIHSEFMTHRVFSRNASSSRAVPVKKMIQEVIDDPAIPVRWGKHQSGMQDAGEHDALVDGVTAETAWLEARDHSVEIARAFNQAGYAKQVINRLLEPFAHISVVVTGVYWENFYTLRDHKDADPTIQALAVAMKEAHDGSVPRVLKHGQWHLPYVTDEECDGHILYDCQRMSAARCARVSYLNHDQTAPSIEKDIELFDRLIQTPVHASPLEHQATPDLKSLRFVNPEKHGNLKGWIQFRKTIGSEAVMEKY